jgi:adenine-specific DNA-methyltransferase
MSALKLVALMSNRISKPCRTGAISFYGWPKVDLFFAAWKSAGFRIGGHIVFRKRYASKTAFLQYRHEAAYLFIKGNPAFPATPLPDVMGWTYTGNKLHPTQKSIHILKPLIETFTVPGQIVLDPFAGSGSTCVAAKRGDCSLRRLHASAETGPWPNVVGIALASGS